MTFVLRSTGQDDCALFGAVTAAGDHRQNVSAIRQAEPHGKRPVRTQANRFAAKGHSGVRMGDAMDDQFRVDLEGERIARRDRCSRAELHGQRVADRPMQMLLEHVLQVAVGLLFRGTGRHGIDSVVFLGHLGPVVIEGIGRATGRRAYNIAASQTVEVVARGRDSRFQSGNSSAGFARRCTSCSRRRESRCREPVGGMRSSFRCG